MSATRRLLLSCALLLAGGCATKPPGLPPPATTPRVQGTLIRVNRAAGLVVAECAILPSPGEEARVLRDDRAVGRIRFTPPARFPYMTADVLDGQPMVGDVFEVRTPPAAPPAE